MFLLFFWLHVCFFGVFVECFCCFLLLHVFFVCVCVCVFLLHVFVVFVVACLLFGVFAACFCCFFGCMFVFLVFLYKLRQNCEEKK